MNISDRILEQRKIKGMSQSELADAIGVSRQSVSKWESEQSLPDMDKIILMSDLFGVTTDYLLKGIEAEKKEASSLKIDPLIFVIIASAFSFLSVIYFLFSDERKDFWVLLCLIVSLAIYFIGLVITKNSTRVNKLFWTINIWPIAFSGFQVICSFISYNASYGILRYWPMLYLPQKTYLEYSPYHINYSKLKGQYDKALGLFIILWIFYLVLCIGVEFIINRKSKKSLS